MGSIPADSNTSSRCAALANAATVSTFLKRMAVHTWSRALVSLTHNRAGDTHPAAIPVQGRGDLRADLGIGDPEFAIRLKSRQYFPDNIPQLLLIHGENERKIYLSVF